MNEPAYQRLSIDTLTETNQNSDHPAAKNTSRFIKSLSFRLKKAKGINEQFFSLTKKLSRLLSLSRAVLIVRSCKNDTLKVIAVRGRRLTRQGLALTLPDRDSILYSVFREGKVYSENLPGRFKGNFIERKLLLDKETASFVISPIICEEVVIGLLCLASPVPHTFAAFEDSVFEEILEPLGKVIKRETNRLNL